MPSLEWDPNLSFLPYGSERRQKQRRWIQNAFGDKAAVHKFTSLQQREACILLSGLIEAPHDFVLHIKRYAVIFIWTQSPLNLARYLASLILESVYGHRITSLDDEYITLVERAAEGTVATGSAGGAMVDFFPLCNVLSRHHYICHTDTRISAVPPGLDARHAMETTCIASEEDCLGSTASAV